MGSGVDNLNYVLVGISLDFFLGGTVVDDTLVIASRVFASFHLFLPIFSPVVPVVVMGMAALGLYRWRWQSDLKW